MIFIRYTSNTDNKVVQLWTFSHPRPSLVLTFLSRVKWFSEINFTSNIFAVIQVRLIYIIFYTIYQQQYIRKFGWNCLFILLIIIEVFWWFTSNLLVSSPLPVQWGKVRFLLQLMLTLLESQISSGDRPLVKKHTNPFYCYTFIHPSQNILQIYLNWPGDIRSSHFSPLSPPCLLMGYSVWI